MSGVADGLQQIGIIKAKIGLYSSPIIAIILCCFGFLIIQASKKPPPPAAPGKPPNKPPSAGLGYCLICLAFLVPLIAYGMYKLTMSSSAFATYEGFEGVAGAIRPQGGSAGFSLF
jgi:hypothetical protein